MEGLTEFFANLWEQLGTINIPIIELNFCEFLIGVFALKVAITVFNYLLSKGGTGAKNDKTDGD